MAENLYTTQTPDSLDNAEATYTMGTELVFSVNGTITGVRWRSATNAISTSPLAKVYSAAGTELASKAAGTLTAGNVWNTTMFDTPLSVVSGTYYVVAFGPINRYSALSGMHGSADVVNGHITAPRNGVGGHLNGRFIANATVAFPTSSGGAGYFVDVLFEAGGSVALPGATVTRQLNRLAGTTGLTATAAANVWAGTSKLTLTAALNAKAGTSKQTFVRCCNLLASTTGLTAADALSRIP